MPRRYVDFAFVESRLTAASRRVSESASAFADLAGFFDVAADGPPAGAGAAAGDVVDTAGASGAGFTPSAYETNTAERLSANRARASGTTFERERNMTLLVRRVRWSARI